MLSREPTGSLKGNGEEYADAAAAAIESAPDRRPSAHATPNRIPETARGRHRAGAPGTPSNRIAARFPPAPLRAESYGRRAPDGRSFAAARPAAVPDRGCAAGPSLPTQHRRVPAPRAPTNPERQTDKDQPPPRRRHAAAPERSSWDSGPRR